MELSPLAQQWINVVLLWLGFGILAGLLARALVPGRQPIGAVATLFVGVLGSALGLLVLSMALGGREFNPIGPVGVLAATGGALVVLVIYRVLSALFAVGSNEPDPPHTVDGA